jgi:hypothetical protein
MPHARQTIVALSAGLLLATHGVAAERLFTLGDDGQTFLYRARPGENPTVVAEMFGLPPQELDAFLAANGIDDPTRVAAGFVYRIPNAAARALAQRTTALEAENSHLTKQVAESAEESQALARATEEARAAAAQAEARSARLRRLATLWPVAQMVIVLLVIATGAACAVAGAALRRQRQAERYARALARELEAKRTAGMAERQETARHILDLETRIRTLEAQLGPRVVISGRSS